MADYPDGVQPTSATIQADTTGLALDEHIYNSSDDLSVYDHTKDIRTQIDDYLNKLSNLALDEHIYNSTDEKSVYDQTKAIVNQLDVVLSKAAQDYLYNSTDAKSAYDQLKTIAGQLDTTLSSLESSLLSEQQLYEQLWQADETTAQSVALDTKGHGKVVSIYANATTATTYTVQVSNDNTNWINVYTSSSAETTYSNSLADSFKGFRYVKLSSAVAGSSGDTVTLIVSAK